MPDNPMGTGMGPSPQMGTPLPGQGPVAAANATQSDPIVAHHEAAKAQHDKVGKVVSQLSAARADMDKLVAMGSAVTDEDVLQAMAKWTANGADPKALI